MKSLDVVTIGRVAVDLYGGQVGGRLEDMGSFRKCLGGSPAAIAAAAARLGLRSALVSRVGDEPMGRYVREQLTREGVDIRGVSVDPDRMTALVLLGVLDETRIPMVFYRENCADMAIRVEHIDKDLIARARVLLISGTHLIAEPTSAAVIHALDLACRHGVLTVLDLDYRPTMPIPGDPAADASARMQDHLALFDLIIGTPEEFRIAGDADDLLTAFAAVRELSDAVLICRQGAAGALVVPGAVPDQLSEVLCVPAPAVEAFCDLGSGEAFVGGLLRGWLAGEDWRAALEQANACWALTVSRHGSIRALPSLAELQAFRSRGVIRHDLRNDAVLEQLHWSTNRTRRGLPDWPDLRIFSFDHRAQLETLPGYSPGRARAFKDLCRRAALQVQQGQPGYGISCDVRIGGAALQGVAETGLWLSRACEWPGARPLSFEPDVGTDCEGLDAWPRHTVAKVQVIMHPDDPVELLEEQEASLRRLFDSARRNELEFLVELVPSRVGPMDVTTLPRLIRRIYRAGVRPDWWKVEAMSDPEAWERTIAIIEDHDRHTRGILVAGRDTDDQAMYEQFALAARYSLVRGFSIGRTIFADAARDWFALRMDADTVVCRLADRYTAMVALWSLARTQAHGLAEEQQARVA